jgi:carbamoyl-phosphate synthase small subunit
MADNEKMTAPPTPTGGASSSTAALVLADGTVTYGIGIGAARTAVGELCFNTSMTGYQEIVTDPSYAGQIIAFTFPHIGNVGANEEDLESTTPAARGVILRMDITEPSNWRATRHLDQWLKSYDLPGIAGVDVRALTRRIRDGGPPNGVVAHSPDGKFDIDALVEQARGFPGLKGMDLARDVTCHQTYRWKEGGWTLGQGYAKSVPATRKVVAIDYGTKRNILRCLTDLGCEVTVVPATATAEEVLGHEPDGVFLSNGPGDPAASAGYAVPEIRKIVDAGKPVFGICFGHQLLALALGCDTEKMKLGHRGANQPVKDFTTGKVEITSQNHGFRVIRESLPETVEETHRSLFDGTLEGIRLKDRPVFSVQYHPEASPGPKDSHYLFRRFTDFIDGKEG